MIAHISALAASLAIAAPAPPAAQNATITARSFLQAFAENPQLTRKLVTQDAFFAFIDMAGPYSHFLDRAGTQRTIFASCDLESLQQVRTIDEKPGPIIPGSIRRPFGHFQEVDGVYSCKRADGVKAFVDVTLWVKGALVASLGIVPRRT